MPATDNRARTIRVSSRALGPRLYVTVKVYETLHDMRTAGTTFSGTDHRETLGLTQARTDDHGRVGKVIVRLTRGHLGTQIVTHEMHHASTALYGSQLDDRISRTVHLNHHNEPFAHLFSDLAYRLVDRLYAYGYYGTE